MSRTNRVGQTSGGLSLLYMEPAVVTNRFAAPHAGRYQVMLDFTAVERFIEAQLDQIYANMKKILAAAGGGRIRRIPTPV